LILAGMIILGGGSLWQDRIGVETYLNESAQGLEVGSMVKMRGVQVGNIGNISFVYNKYPEAFGAGYRYVLVEISLHPDKLGTFPGDEIKEMLEQEVRDGLRVTITPQGLTGSAYLELDYINPLRAVALPINWTPRQPYIPSAPGTIARFEETFESVSNTLKNLEAINLGEPVQRMEELLSMLLAKVDVVQTEAISTQSIELLTELRRTNARLAKMLGQQEPDVSEGSNVQAILNNVSTTINELRQMVQMVNQWLQDEQGGINDLQSGVSGFQQAMSLAPGAVQNFSNATQRADDSFVRFQQLVRQVSTRLTLQQEKLDAVLHHLEQTGANIRDITDDARTYPSRLFFGEPPEERSGEAHQGRPNMGGR